MRLFTGIIIPRPLAERLKLIQFGLPGAKWIEPTDFHITLRFLGDVDGPMANDIIEGYSTLSSEPFDIQLRSVGAFGGNKPRMVWAGLAPSSQLTALYSANEIMAQSLGLSAEGRKFTPHVTLARLSSGQSSQVANYLVDHGNFQSEVFQVKGFALYSARASKGGGPYIVEEFYEF